MRLRRRPDFAPGRFQGRVDRLNARLAKLAAGEHVDADTRRLTKRLCRYGQYLFTFLDYAVEINSGCCGMAGSFGHESEHYDIAQAVGEQRLFPAVRDRREAEIAVSGFSCRCQIEHHTGVRPRHVIELVAEAIRSDG